MITADSTCFAHYTYHSNVFLAVIISDQMLVIIYFPIILYIMTQVSLAVIKTSFHLCLPVIWL